MSPKHKICIAVLNTQPPHLYFGGVETRIVEIAKRLHGKVDTKIYSGTKKGFKKATSFNGTAIVPCFSTDLFFPVDNWVFNRTVPALLGRVDADVFEAHTVSGYGLLRAMKTRGTSKPFVQTVHGVLADEYIQSLKGKLPTFRTKLSNAMMWHLARLESESAQKATFTVTVSAYSSRRIFQLYNVDKAKIRIVPSGVDPQRFKPMEDCEKIKQKIKVGNKQCVLFVGSLIPRKGLHFLIEAARQIVKEEVVFVVVGEGPLKKHLVAQIIKLGLSDHFVFLGNVSDDVLPTLYNCCDVFVSPSIQEGQGLTLLEAQASAKPVVAFQAGAVGESVINNETGLLVEPNSNELAKAILALLSNRSLRESMGQHGREFVCKNFSWDVCAKKMYQIYTEALQLT